MMNFIPAQSGDRGASDMAERITAALSEGRKALWLVCGGSSIPIAAKAMRTIRENLAENVEPARDPKKTGLLANLTVALTDERYGPPGHPDSNWTQLSDAGFDARGANAVPVLVGKSLDATVSEYADSLRPIMEDVSSSGGLILAMFGVGADGHIAGMLPRSPAVTDPRLVVGYEAGQYIRVTLTAVGILKVDEAYVFVFGDSKRRAVADLRDRDLPIDDEPAGILKNIPKVFIWSDVLD